MPESFRSIARSGTPVLHLTLGFIEPHLMLGFSGGRKLIAPGLAAQETIKVLHSPKFMRDARAVEGSVEDNPLHRELLEIARMARHDFIVDVALTRDRKIAGVFAGDAEPAHAAGMRFVSKVMLEQLDGPADAVITSSAGYPLDLTFYQAVKGITAAQHIVRPGGRILLVAECSEGPGAAEFRELLKRTPSHRDYLDSISTAPVIVDQWQLEKLALVAEKAQVLFYTPGLPQEYRSALWGRIYDSAAEAVSALTAGLPDGATIALMPEGPYVLARTATAA
jgi:lactate racemase